MSDAPEPQPAAGEAGTVAVTVTATVPGSPGCGVPAGV